MRSCGIQALTRAELAFMVSLRDSQSARPIDTAELYALSGDRDQAFAHGWRRPTSITCRS
jgi:hypothetical protein